LQVYGKDEGKTVLLSPVPSFSDLLLTDIVTYRSSKKMKERRCCKEEGRHRRDGGDLNISEFHGGEDDGC
jgi:hypothetical protein